ncbi:hypothetical protein PL372_11160 [Tenacibaculum dicentrarchi]|nr:hypothetical protein [Tenacibaculum dicentrarchi]
MENIDEELRQYKLFKIQETISKLKRFEKKHNQIKQRLVIKVSKNVTSNIIRLLLIIISILFLTTGIILLFREKIIENQNINFNLEGKIVILSFAISLILLSILFITTSYLLRLNNRKRNNIYSLAELLEEVMIYMKKSRDEDKIKYEQL